MRKYIRANGTLVLLLAVFLGAANCVPTSVLAGSKDSKLNNPKVKRSSSVNTESASSSSVASLSSASDSLSNHKSDVEISPIAGKSEISLGGSSSNNRANAGYTETKSAPQKRGVNSQLMYGDIFNTVPAAPIGNPARNGVWADELDPAVVYPDIQDFEDYQRGTYNVKPYDNIREILNSEPIAMPLQYPYRYYGDRRKRSNIKPLDARPKRDSKLTPADMLALVALVEAGERSRFENENEDNYGDYPRQYMGPYNSPMLDDENEELFADPSNFVSSPYNLDSIPLYDIVKPPKPSQRFGTKRYMVSKKKRSLGPYANDVTDRSNIKLNGHFPTHFVLGKAPKRFQTAF